MNPALETLRECGYLSSLDVHFAKTMARIAKTEDTLVMLGAAVANRYTMNGHVCAPISALGGKQIDTIAHKTEKLHWPRSSNWISALEKSPLVHCAPAEAPTAPLLLESGRLYLTRYWMYEKCLARKILARASTMVDKLDDAVLQQGIERLFSKDLQAQDYQQSKAAQVALKRRLAIISGGPGTGKTSTVVKILVLLFEQAAARAQHPRVIMLAPTGKAAQRLEESTRNALDTTGPMEIRCGQDIKDRIRDIAGSTIHRALGYKPETPTRFRHNANKPLNADLVIVDEASMVDLPLMAKLFDSVDEKARLIVIGDPDQLVSVEAGAVLGDICKPVYTAKGQQSLFTGMDTGIGNCVVKLTHSFRFSSGQDIDLLARAINDGKSKKAMEYLKGEQWPDVVLMEPGDKTSLLDIIAPIIKKHYGAYLRQKDPQKRLQALGDFRILCAHRKGPTGSVAINALSERILGLRSSAGPEPVWYDGQPIMISRNDYQLELFNGDVGVISSDENHGNRLRAFFPGKKSSYLPSRLPPHATVFAMTAHKSQGSEYDNVLILLPEQASPVVTRELLYTAVTRARKTASIVASTDVLYYAVDTPVLRTSGLGQALWPSPSNP